MGPITARTSPGQQAIETAARPAQRATYERGRGHGGKREPDKRGYVFGALWESTGTCWTCSYPSRSKANFIDFLCLVDSQVPASIQRIYAVMDNLNIHHSEDLLLFTLHYPRWEWVYQPTYAAYLNLIESWWKVLQSLALKGHHFQTWQEVSQAVEEATACWNAHKHPLLWGRRRRHQPLRLRDRSPFARYLKKTRT
ncbi:MAG TPA: transposase [Ktedonobacteraceae bacterium]